MPPIEFKYSQFKEYYLPIIPIQIKGDGRWHEVRVFVDSGATYSVLEYKEVERLNVDVSGSEKRYVKVGDGGYISVNIVSLPVKIGYIEILARIGFSKDLGVGFNLLGRKDVFENFTVCLNDKKRVITFIGEESTTPP